MKIPKNNLLYFIVNCKKRYLAILFIIVYLSIGLFFGLIYFFFSDNTNNNLLNILYCSYLLQFGLDSSLILSTRLLDRVFFIIHLIFSNLWLAFIPSVILVKLITPSEDVFQFDKNLVFYPTLQIFRFRYVNLSKMNAVNLLIDLRSRIIINSDDFNIRNLSVQLNNDNLPDARSLVPFFLSTKPISSDEYHQPIEKIDYKLTLHPGHINNNLNIILRVSCEYATGPFNKTVEFNYFSTHCGKFKPIQIANKQELNWKNLNQYLSITATEDGRNFCMHSCAYRNNCNIMDKW